MIMFVFTDARRFDSTDEYKFPEELLAKTHYCGYVCREDAKTPVDNDFVAHFFPEPVKNLFDHRGGSDASYFMDAFLDAARLLPRKPPLMP
jgi:predicted glycosyltransferase